MRDDLEHAVVCVIGLGYVGLPLAEAFSRSLKVISFDIDREKLGKLSKNAHDKNLVFTDRTEEIGRADFIIICVPTPLTKSREPDLSYVEGAARVSGQNMKRGSTVILESTVYPGVTEDIVKPILEESSGLECGRDFKIGYSPERVNPGDTEHTISRVTKVVSGMDAATTDTIARLYRKVTPHIFKARNIKTAESAKVIENIQRDLNIALMNELALIFERMGLSIRDVIEAAATKWNFHRYLPGLVGGHCIPVDPYYLVYRAQELGYHPQVILAGRAINDCMPGHIAEMTVRALNDVGRVVKGSRVLIMGLTYKENVADTRETPVKEIIRELRENGVEIFGYDPLLSDIEDEFGIRAVSSFEAAEVDGTILAVVHDDFRRLTLDGLRGVMSDKPVLIDVRGFFDREEAERKGIYYRQL